MFDFSLLWKAPEINPINRKARSIPVLNPVNLYGRVINFSWFGFFVAFWSWYAFPPLLSLTIAKDIGASAVDVANSNIVALLATLLVRFVAGPACDRFGPRKTFAALLLMGSLPTVLAGAVTNARGLIALRFFVGILGGSFVPCQVWTTGFFDKNVIGTANAFTAGFGNAGGGVTYFIMPAVFDSLVYSRGLSFHVAWRVSFIVPSIIIVVTAVAMLLTCPDTPTGPWEERFKHTQENLTAHGVQEKIVTVPGQFGQKGTSTPTSDNSEKKIDFEATGKITATGDHEAQIAPQEMLDVARGEVIQKPTWTEARHVILSPQTLVLAACYACSFGAELAINSILGNYYFQHFPALGQSGTGQWAAMFGLLNIVTRPFGGIVSDMLYRRTKNVMVKKIWIHAVGVITGIFLIIIGTLNPNKESVLFGLFAGMAVFLESGNGANFSLVPHVHPFANGIVSGCVGGIGNLGGIIFAIVFRYNTINYARSIWIIGVITLAVHVATCWIKPIPKGQIGGR